MPFIATPGFATTPGSFDFGGFGGIIQSGLNLASSILAPKPAAPTPGFPFGPTRQDFGFQQAGLVPFASKLPAIARQLPGVGIGVGLGEAAEGLFSLFGGASDTDSTAAFTDPVPGRCRPKAHIKVNPCTGKGTWFTPRGKPLVFSGDMAACKRVDRVAKRLDKARPKRRAKSCRP